MRGTITYSTYKLDCLLRFPRKVIDQCQDAEAPASIAGSRRVHARSHRAERRLAKLVYLVSRSDMAGYPGCRRVCVGNSMWRNLQRPDGIELGGEVNWLIDDPCGERLPTIDLAHVDLTGGEQHPERRWRISIPGLVLIGASNAGLPQ
jgi:hypothetical protein